MLQLHLAAQGCVALLSPSLWWGAEGCDVSGKEQRWQPGVVGVGGGLLAMTGAWVLHIGQGRHPWDSDTVLPLDPSLPLQNAVFINTNPKFVSQ